MRRVRAIVRRGGEVRVADRQKVEVEVGLVRCEGAAASVVRPTGELVGLGQHVAELRSLAGMRPGGQREAVREQERLECALVCPADVA